jgi:transcriptional regulator with XRE-family HTH domain
VTEAAARKQLAERLRLARESAELSQDVVAQALGLPRAAISQIEHGHRRVEVIELARLAKLYGKSLSYFAGEEASSEGQQFELLKRTTADLSEQDRAQVIRFAEFLRNGASGEAAKR